MVITNFPIADLRRLTALEREKAGTRAAEHLRKNGRIPAILFSLPQNKSRLISLDSHQLTSLVRPFLSHIHTYRLDTEIDIVQGDGACMLTGEDTGEEGTPWSVI
jgi:ribosomal protein L25 (general stress protein Ctc)